jgi:cytochrome b561
MHAQGHPSILVTILILALVAWRLYARTRRMIGRQRLSKWRPWVTVTLFPLVLLLLAVLSRHQPPALWALAGGATAGIALGILGLKLTQFENTPTGATYTPSAHLGIALSTLLVLRIGYRFIQTSQSVTPAAPPTYSNSPITLLIFGALALYYVTYAAGLIRWSRRINRNANEQQEVSSHQQVAP